MTYLIEDTQANRMLRVELETQAIEDIYRTIQPFTPQERTRILDWLVAKLEQDRDVDAVASGIPQPIGGDRG
jgi:hypothetical protein